MTEDSAIVTPQELAEEEMIRKSVQAIPRDDLVERFMKLLLINNASAARINAMEDALQDARGHLAREKKLNKDIKRKRGGKKMPSEPWHELVNAMDPSNYTKLPLEGRVFLLGHIDDVIVVEVPKETTEQEMNAARKGLHNLGMTSAAVIIREGTKFMKLVPVPKEQSDAIEAKMKEAEAKNAEVAQEAPAEATPEAEAATH